MTLTRDLAIRLPFRNCPPPSKPDPSDWELNFLSDTQLKMLALRSRLTPTDSYGSPWQWAFKNGFISEGYRDLKDAEVDELRAFWEVIEAGWPWLADIAKFNTDYPQSPIDLYRDLLCERWLCVTVAIALKEKSPRAIPGFTRLCQYVGNVNAGREVNPKDLKGLGFTPPLLGETLEYLKGTGDRLVKRKIKSWENAKKHCAHQLGPIANRQRKGRAP